MKNWPFGLLSPYRYSVIYADPPWRYQNYASEGIPQTTDKQHYPTMSLDELKALPVKDLAAENCALLMWSTSAVTDQAFDLAAHWGFKFKGKAFAWSKLNPFWGKGVFDNRMSRKITDDCHWFMGMGRSSRKNTEDCWLFTRGAPKRLNADVRELVIAPVRDHSRKPDIHNRVERLFGGPHCELFSRTNRKGWDAWGRDVGKFK